MASGVTRISDVVVPSIFTPYVQQLTTAKSRIIQSGLASLDPAISALIAGGGLTFNVPSFKDLDDDTENVSTDDPTIDSTPNKIGSATEIAVRLNRNQSWSSMDLAAALADADPMRAIADRVAAYWTRRYQAALIATLTGVFADNAAAPGGSDTHTQNDMTNDVSGASFVNGVTNFTTEAFIDALVTMGDSQSELSAVIVHSVVYARMQKNNLIDFVPDSTGLINIPTFLGREVIVDDGTPRSSTIYQTWLLGTGAIRIGTASPAVPTEIDRKPSAGTGSGQDVLHSRVQLCIHPTGYAYIGTAPNGGPDNTANSHMLAAAGSWSRRWPQRKQIKIARLITREA